MSKPHTPEEVAEVSAMLNERDQEELNRCCSGQVPDVRECPVLENEGLVYLTTDGRGWKVTALGELVSAKWAGTTPAAWAAGTMGPDNEWEPAASDGTDFLQVPGGRIYRSHRWRLPRPDAAEMEPACMVFVPDTITITPAVDLEAELAKSEEALRQAGLR